MTDDPLHDIQQMQFTDKQQAENLLLSLIRETFPIEAIQVELRPLAVSLNSFNGFVTLRDGNRLFFKSHAESDTVIREYYNAEMLANVGYPVIQPMYRSTEIGRQILLYDVITDPPVFDLAWQIEQGDMQSLPELTEAQNRADRQLFDLYCATLGSQPAHEAATAPIHQLFYHRLTGGRLTRFYGFSTDQTVQNINIDLPNGSLSMNSVRTKHWVINGQRYSTTIEELIRDAVEYLRPDQNGPSIIGHGDAHNGNVFYRRLHQSSTLVYFDPAFAGRHHPLLDLTKPLFHNVFAMWMYYPIEKQQTTRIALTEMGAKWHVDYEYDLPPIRKMFLTSKVENTLIPTLKHLKSQGMLRSDWRKYLKLALFCCPFLTMNLADKNRFSPQISLLGLAMAVEMGAESAGEHSLIDQTLDRVASALE